MKNITTYEEAITYLFEQLPMYSKIGQKALKPSLDNIIALCAAMNNIQNELKLIHVAGSNGKGSCSHMIAATLQQAGYKVGLYTSPHLLDLRERFRINGALIPKPLVVRFLNEYQDIITKIEPSYFELNVALAFYVFHQQKVDYAVIEVGLGGVWDSTNIITPLLSVITNISLEHTAILGDTLALIAEQKAGIIKPKVPVVIGETNPETEAVFFLNAHHKQSPIVFADARWDIVKTNEDEQYQYYKLVDKATFDIQEIKTDLKGSYQSKNIVTVSAVIHALSAMVPHLQLTHLYEVLPSIQSTTGLHGRWETIHQQPTIIIDVAHNPGGMEFLNENMSKISTSSQLHFILGFANDKDVAKVMPYFPKLATYYFTQANIPRAMDATTLGKIAEVTHKGTTFLKVGDAIDACLAAADTKDTIIITGSFFIIADALHYLKDKNIIL